MVNTESPAKLTDEQAEDAFWGEEPDGWGLVQERIADKGRWSYTGRRVFKLPDGSFYHVCMSIGATECQDNRELVCHGPCKEVPSVDYEPV